MEANNDFNFAQVRKRRITKYVIFIVLLCIIAIVLLFNISKNQVHNVVYTESSDIDYKVYLKKNDFFTGEYVEANNQYIASLIDYIQTEMNYKLEAQEKNIEYEFSYSVAAEIDVQDKATRKSLYKITDDLIKEGKYYTNTDEALEIREVLKIDYNKYNDLINKFVELYDLEDYNANLIINMYVNIYDEDGNINGAGTPVATLNVPLTEKTMSIDIESNSVNESSIMAKAVNNNGYIFGAAILFIVAIVMAIRLKVFIKDTESEDSLYRMKLRKIMMSYSSYIQKIDSEYSFEGKQIIEIKLFEDLLQLRETLNKPVLMVEKENAKETYFFVPADNTIYLYELNPGELTKKEHPEMK